MQISAATGDNINKLKYSVGAVVRQMRSGSYEGPRPLRKPREKVTAVRPKAKKKAVAKKAAVKKPANQQKSASKRVAQSRRSQTARPSAGRKKATAARPKKKLSLK